VASRKGEKNIKKVIFLTLVKEVIPSLGHNVRKISVKAALELLKINRI